MKSLIKTLTFFLLFSSCDKLFNDDELTLPLISYMGDELRIDGYYYRLNDRDEIFNVHFFYNNGVVLIPDGLESNPEEMDDYIIKHFLNSSRYKKTRYKWGVFLIENDVIKFERWYPSERPHRAYMSAGLILNDTTFCIIEFYRSRNGEKTEFMEIDELFHFRLFSPKPDSTNRFVR